MARLPDPLSRRDRQRQTREALVFAARAVFARDGYHRANLEVIAREAGFSKGAVYSNFANKAALFLAVMDANLETALAESWDPFSRVDDVPVAVSGDMGEEELAAAMRGFGLATLEFIAVAARDEALSAEMAERMQRLIAAYTEIAREHAAEDDPMPAEELGPLLAALDQGAGMLVLTGNASVDQRLLRTGARRLLDPARSVTAEDDGDAGVGVLSLHSREVQARIAAALRDQPF